jgi:dimethylsulfide dehydrogenase subunit alpha/complex iron-sulfur molybdoenzyme family reductase subunit alpha
MDYILLWGINPNVTRIPDAHYLWEGKYNGAKVVNISPDYNPTSIHADQWVPIKPGADSFLAMSMINVIFKENLYKKSFIKEQTDLPFLVRKDNGKLLRGADMEKDGGDEIFYMWDTVTSQAVKAPGTRGSKRDTLRLDRINPALKGSFEVKGKDGETIAVTTAFEISWAEAAKYSPEATQSKTGIHPNVVRKMAREFAKAKKAGLTIGFSLHKYAWGILACWAQGLICALTGHAADTGGLDTESQWSLGGIGPLSSPKPARFESGVMSEWMAGRMWESFNKHYDDDEEFRAKVGMGTADLLDLAKESLDKKWLTYYGEPRARIIFADNLFRRNKASEHYKKSVLDKTDLYVNVNYRMDSSAELADYVLPGHSHYEGWDIRGEVGYHRFVNLVVPPKGLKPVGEAKSEWEICSLLSQYIEKAAKKRGLEKITDPEFKVTKTIKVKEGGKEVEKTETGPVIRDLDTLHKDFTMDNTLLNDKDVVKWLIANVPAFKPWKFEDAAERGFIVLNKEAGFSSPLYATKPYHSFESQVYLRRPYLTVSGRQQYYIDQEVFLRLGSPTPTARESLHPKKFPFKFYTPHTRWGIHSTWRTNKYMMRMQRGAPHVSLNPDDAKARGIIDGANIRVFNDVGNFEAMAKINATVMPGTLMMDHAWEPHQFKERRGLNAPVAGALSPLELAGGWGHLKFGAAWDGNQLALESTVEVKKV